MAGSAWYSVGVGGQARSGKDTLGAHLLRRLNGFGELGRWQRRGFADAVKSTFRDAFGVDERFVETWKAGPAPPRLPQGGGDGRRVGQPDRRGDTAGGSSVAFAEQSGARRTRSGIDQTGSPLLPIRGRLQHLRAQPPRRRTCPGQRTALRDDQAAAEGQRVEKCRCPARGAEVPRLEYRERRQPEANRACGDPEVQGTGPGTDASDTRGEPDQVDRAIGCLPGRLAGLLWLLPDAAGAVQPRCVDT